MWAGVGVGVGGCGLGNSGLLRVERSGDEDEPGRKNKNKCMVFKTASVGSIGFVF